MKKFNIILATDLNGGIGYQGTMPWKFISDALFFKVITQQHSILSELNKEPNILIMGRKTWESIGKKNLDKRLSFVITSQYEKLNNENFNNTLFFPNLNAAYMESFKYDYSDVWIIGGRDIFNDAFNHYACDKIYLTLIHDKFNTDVSIDLHNYNIKWTHQIDKTDINKIDNKEYKLTFCQGVRINNVEHCYLESLFSIVNHGDKRDTRNGITYSLFNKTISWDLADGFPLLTTKKMFWKGIVEELLFFIRGDTNTNKLSDKGVKIWEPNTRKSFLESIGLDYPEGEMGPMYGYQWRFFNKPYPEHNPEPESNHNLNNGLDQLKKIINEIKTDPHSRRILMTDYNPAQVHQGVLYPCHSIVIQFYISNNKLSCSMYQRSVDFFLGLPFNIASTSLLLYIISSLTNLNVGSVNLIMGDYHIYNTHLEQVNEQLHRIPRRLPKLVMPKFETIEQVEQSSLTDYQILDYVCYPAIKAQMIA